MNDERLSQEELELIEIRNEFIDESIDGLEGAADEIVRFEADPTETSMIDAIFRTAHSIKGNAAFFELMSLKSLAHVVENVLGALRKEEVTPTRPVVEAVLAGLDELLKMLTRVRDGETEVDDEGAYEALLMQLASAQEVDPRVELERRLARAGELLAGLEGHPDLTVSGKAVTIIEEARRLCESASVGPGREEMRVGAAETKKSTHDEQDTSASDPAGSRDTKAAVTDTGKTMRVREEAIDTFFEHVGELLVVGEMYDNLRVRLGETGQVGLVKDMQHANEAFSVLSNDLQASIAEIRKVPARVVLRSATRIIRDVAAERGKEIDVRVDGERVLVDKSIAEAFEAPLVHMVRNAADHGIEFPDEREAAGKPRTGSISVEVTASASEVILSVSDDGRGLDRERLRGKAVELGIVSADRPLSDDAVVDLLFRAGVSTAEKVTDVSGRGVGMDVVKRNIDAMGGRIEVDTMPGEGSTFRVVVPATVSTRIIQGIGVVSGGERFILPADHVVRFLQLDAHDVHTVMGRGTVIRTGEQVLPCYELSGLLGIENGRPDQEEQVAVLVEVAGAFAALRVDRIEASRQVVLKDMVGIDDDHGEFLGVAVTGDGTLALVVDCEAIVPATARV